MCGIAGIWNKAGGEVTRGAGLAMQKALLHRGPDDAGLYMAGPIALAHTRLSIIDLSSHGAQPFVSSDGNYILTFNGEIYNYKQLQEKYLVGVPFRSTSDTEVLLELLILKGERILPELRGMFAFALYDVQKNELLLARDAFGKKPLFYAWTESMFLFASEPKAILASGYVKAEVDVQAIPAYLFHEYCPQPSSGYANIVTLGAGQYMKVNQQVSTIKNWYTAKFYPKAHVSFDSALHTFDELLSQAVERRMVADVPVGLFLSGGLDSSTIGWYMRSINAQADIHSCSVGFAEASFNEGHYAERVADDLKFIHHTLDFSYDILLQSMQEMISLMDIPFADASLLPTYAISKLARKHMKVVLDGDGSDEILGGYGTFTAYELASRLQWIPKLFWQGSLQVADFTLPVSHAYFSADFKIKSFLRGMVFGQGKNMQAWLGAFSEQEIGDILVTKQVLNFDEYRVAGNNAFDRASSYHLQAYLERDILVKLDRATMAVGLEARTPFLDVDVVDFVLKLPPQYKRGKRLLRELMTGRLHTSIITRKKQGFGIPISEWFTASMRDFVEDVLSFDRISAVGVFTYDGVKKLLNEHTEKRHDHRKKIWTIIMFQLWYEYWILGQRNTLHSGVPPQIS